MKKTIRVFLASFLILCLFSVSAFAFAAQVPGEITDGNQNLEAYISETDKHAIQKVIGELLNIRSEQITSLSQSVDYSRFWSPNAETVNRQIFDNCINGKLAVISNLDVARKNSVSELKFSNYNKVGNVVHVEVSEWLPFAYCEKTLEEQPSEYTSGEENTYAFDLEKCGDEWKILAVDFKDIFYDHLKKPDVSIDSFVQGCLDGGRVYIAEEIVDWDELILRTLNADGAVAEQCAVDIGKGFDSDPVLFLETLSIQPRLIRQWIFNLLLYDKGPPGLPALRDTLKEIESQNSLSEEAQSWTKILIARCEYELQPDPTEPEMTEPIATQQATEPQSTAQSEKESQPVESADPSEEPADISDVSNDSMPAGFIISSILIGTAGILAGWHSHKRWGK